MSEGRRQTVAVDVDMVLFPFVQEILQYHNATYQTSVAFEDVTSFDLWRVWGGTKEEAIRKVEDFFHSSASRAIPPIPGAFQALQELHEQYHLVVVTARSTEFEAVTRAWIQEHFPSLFREMAFGNHFAPGAIPKSSLCLQIGADILVDDHVVHARECAARGVRTLLFGDYPWNRADVLPENVRRVTGWDEVCRVLLPGKA